MIIDRFRRPKPTPPPASPEAEDASPGWDAISATCERVFGGQKEFHWGTLISWELGGSDPLAGVSAYRGTDPIPHWHYVTYGLSDLYGENAHLKAEAQVGEIFPSGYGIEYTFRLADPAAADPDGKPPVWVANLVQNVARYVFTSNNLTLPGHYMNANGPITQEEATTLSAVLFREDTLLGTIDSDNGQIQFVEVIGVAGDELEAVMAWNVFGVLDVISELTRGGLTILDRVTISSDPALVDLARQGAEREGSRTSVQFVDEAHVDLAGGVVSIRLKQHAIQSVVASLQSRLSHDQPLEVEYNGGAIVFMPEEAGDEPVREVTADAAVISLSDEGVAALAAAPLVVGEYQFNEIPGVRIIVAPSHSENKEEAR